MSERDHATEFDFSDMGMIQIPVTGPGNKTKYILQTADVVATARFKNARAECASFTDGGLSSVKGVGDLPRFLVHLTLFNTNSDGSVNDKNNINPTVLGRWPGPVVEKLYEEAMNISEIDNDDDLTALTKERDELNKRIKKIKEDAAKNEPSDTDHGSSLPRSEATADP